MGDWLNKIHVGDCRALMRQMIADKVKVQCIVTSPPYWGLRDYGVAGQFGLERTWVRHVARMRHVFRLCRELLADDGTVWLNYGDSYATGTSTPRKGSGAVHGYWGKENKAMKRVDARGIAPKNLIGMPWRLAFTLQADGWYLRQDIIWSKPNPMPESVRDRCTKAHEYLFLFAKRERYFWDFEAMQEDVSWHVSGNKTHKGVTAYAAGDETQRTKGGLVKYAAKVREDHRKALRSDIESRHRASIEGGQSMQANPNGQRNKRSVWTVPSEPFKEAHFATFPRALIEPCILAGSRPGDIVFDPFMGSGTTAEVASDLGRQFIGCELNPAYAAMFKSHRSQQIGMGL